jgi:hypothetical protein
LWRASINALSKPAGESVQKLLSGTARGELPLRVVYGTSFADGCIRVQRSNLQVTVEPKYLTVKKRGNEVPNCVYHNDTVKPFSGKATGKLLFGVARCDNVLYCFECFRRVFFYLHRVGGLVFGLLGPVLGAPLWCALASLGFPAGLFSSAVG